MVGSTTLQLYPECPLNLAPWAVADSISFLLRCASSSPSTLRSQHLQLAGPMFLCPVGHHLFRKLLRLGMDMPHVLTILRTAGLNSLCIALLPCVNFDEKEKIGKRKRMKEMETPGIPLESNLMCPTGATQFIAPFRRHDSPTKSLSLMSGCFWLLGFVSRTHCSLWFALDHDLPTTLNQY